MTDTIEPPELAPVRPGEELDWASLEAYLREQHPRAGRPAGGAAVPRAARPTSRTCCASATPSWCCGGRRSAQSRPAPTTCAASTGAVAGCGGTSTGRRAPTCSATTTTSSAPTSSSWSAAGARSCGTTCPTSMAHHPDVGRRIGFAVVDAMADLHLLDPTAVDLADLGRPDGFVERQVPGWSKRWDLVDPTTGCRSWTTVADRLPRRCRRRHAGLGRAQRPQARQLPVRPGRPRSGAVDLRLGHDDARRAAGRPRHAAQLLARPVRPARRPAASATRACWRWGCRRGPRSRPATPSAPASTSASAGWYEAFAQWKTGVVIQQLHNRWKRGESTDPRMAVDRRPPAGPGRQRVAPARRAQSLSSSWARPQRRAMPLIQRCGSAALRSMNVCMSGWVRMRNRSSFTPSITRAAASSGGQHLAAADHGAGLAGITAGAARAAWPCRRRPGRCTTP